MQRIDKRSAPAQPKFAAFGREFLPKDLRWSTTARAVKTALAHNDEETLKKYECSLDPILQTVKLEH
jgi:hypothetical protein